VLDHVLSRTNQLPNYSTSQLPASVAPAAVQDMERKLNKAVKLLDHTLPARTNLPLRRVCCWH
jgi:hypothetical protein